MKKETISNNKLTVKDEVLIGMYKTYTVETAIEYALQYKVNRATPRPNSPDKPYLKTEHTVEDVLLYAEKLKQYNEVDNPKYQIELGNYRKWNAEIDCAIIEYIKDKSCLNDIPEQYRDNVFNLARNEESHWYSIYIKLLDLIAIF
jgi:hypothetical protein